MEIKVSRTLVQDERVFNSVLGSISHEDVFWFDNTTGYFDSVEARAILFEDFTHTRVIYISILPEATEIRTPS